MVTRGTPRETASLLRRWILTGLSLLIAGSGTAVETDFKERVLDTPSGQIVIVTYKGEDFRRVLIEDLDLAERWHGQSICVEGKFEDVIGTIRLGTERYMVLSLLGSNIHLLYPEHLGRPALIRGDNVWVGGMIEQEPGGDRPRIRVRGLTKLPNDKELFDERFGRYRQQGNYRQLIELGHWIGKASETSGAFVDHDVYKRMQRKAYKEGLSTWARESDPNAADVQYHIGSEYLNLLNDTLNADRHMLRCVAIDPKHKKAVEYLKRAGYVYDEKRQAWVTPREKDMTAGDGSSGTGPVTPETGNTQAAKYLSVAERDEEILRITRLCLAGTDKEVDILVDEASRVEDPALAIFLVSSLRMRPERRALEGIKKAATLKNRDVILAALGSLLYRHETSAGRDLLDVAAKIEDKDLIRDVLALFDRKPERVSLPLLVEMLSLGNERLAEAAEDKLSAITGLMFGSYPEWRSWWEANRDNY